MGGISSAVKAPNSEGYGRQVAFAQRFDKSNEFLAHRTFGAAGPRARAPYATVSNTVMPIGKRTPVSGPGQTEPTRIPIAVAVTPSAASHLQYGAYSILAELGLVGLFRVSFQIGDTC